jgi:CBS-domain-containing membrane protein
MTMKVKDLMSRDVKIVAPNDTLEKAAKLMATIDAGSLPVGQDDRLVGMLTDRDITVRAVARNKSPAKTHVRDVMTSDIKYVFEDEGVEDVARNMSNLQIRRLPVVNRDKRLVGIVSLGDLARKHGGDPAEKALHNVSQPSRAA